MSNQCPLHNLPPIISYPPRRRRAVLPASACTTVILFGSFTQFSSFPMAFGLFTLKGAHALVWQLQIQATDIELPSRCHPGQTLRNLPPIIAYPPRPRACGFPGITPTTLILFGSFTQFSCFPRSAGFAALNGAHAES